MDEEEKEETKLMQKRAYEREKRLREYLERKHRSSQKKKEVKNG